MALKNELNVPLDQLAEYVSPTAFNRYIQEEGHVPRKGIGRFSLRNARERLKVNQAQAGVVFDEKDAKNRRRNHNKSLHRPAGRHR